jgi:hypothetical protein
MKKFLPLLALLLPACASMSSMDNKDMADVPTKTFTADKTTVVKATEITITKLGYELKETRVSEPTTQILFSKPMSAFSWGEVGRIDVTGLNSTGTSGSSIVSIGAEKRYRLQITGMSQKDFANKIFSGIEANLPK